MRGFSTWIAALAVLCMTTPTTAATDSSGGNRQAKSPTLAEIDDSLQLIRSMSWNLPQQLEIRGFAESVRGMERDLERFVLTEAVLERIALLREQLPAAIPQGDDRVPAEAALPLTRVLGQELCRMLHLNVYWATHAVRGYHRDMIASLARSLPDAEQAATLTRLDGIDRPLEALRETATSPDSCELDESRPIIRELAQTQTEAMSGYNALRSELAEQLDRLASERGELLPAPVRRPTACPPPVAPPAESGQARLLSRGDVGDYYPAEMRDREVEGRVRVRIEVDTGGCVITASVAGSSGADALDQAAIRAAFDMSFVPGVVDGTPANMTFIAPFSFSFAPTNLPGR